MAVSRIPKPMVETDDIDESWDDFEPSREGESIPTASDRQIFDRQTAVPSIPPERLAQSPIARRTPVVQAEVVLPTQPAPGKPPDPPAAPTTRQPPSAPLVEFSMTSEPPDGIEDVGVDAGPASVLEHEEASTVRRLNRDSIETGRPPPPPQPSDSPALLDGPVRRSDYLHFGSEPVAGEAETAEPPPRIAESDLALDLDGAIETLGSPLDLVNQVVQPRAGVQDASAEPVPASERKLEGATAVDMQDRYAVGDFTGALVIAESILDGDPDDTAAQRYAQSCREVLTQMYAARLGPIDQVISVAVPLEQITWLSLDHRAGFLLSLVDGVSSIEELLDISGMNRLEAMRILYTLVQQNVITLE